MDEEFVTFFDDQGSPRVVWFPGEQIFVRLAQGQTGELTLFPRGGLRAEQIDSSEWIVTVPASLEAGAYGVGWLIKFDDVDGGSRDGSFSIAVVERPATGEPAPPEPNQLDRILAGRDSLPV